ncbi:hypothetical protein, variant 4 [Aphanomyces astaci]|uniref:Transmembrane protein n=1 Tax=Aphanomyces astaci TaxID=112090 RepID=W4H191_APHAT|nr:hypothetical protein, variant 2 [Aphanomyces astaci]XP_009825373.1 hypothetical protein, variant 3 [Aphanomyces astaci]XP_009825374.1 hypothetical protein, variant 4 [Aphanomyces astaci]ETV85354.1 hypothetical protein, variant 2 [Aphanomyces astaci]ETV85355.1 hypothetical protein, variant 3 [Aphanomyces astaci]ETV85356.1 hypothetical protein, variant 4 [Aphanomyces astaci]|eukprot:XP_009825372.1 hypothetical protein, variant 2 [Aphanomyces astaci]
MGYELLRQHPALGGVAACGSLMLLTAILHPSWVAVVRASDDASPWQVTMGPVGLYIHESSLMQSLFPAFNRTTMTSETWGGFCAQGNHAADVRFAGICGTTLTAVQCLLVVAALLCFAAQVALWQSRVKCRVLVGASALFSALAVTTVGVLRLWLNVLGDFALALSSMAEAGVSDDPCTTDGIRFHVVTDRTD